MNRQRVVNLIALMVVMVWALVTLVALVTNRYTVLEAVTPVMMVVAGFLFGAKGGK